MAHGPGTSGVARHNNFDLLRHLAASTVLWTHSFSLSRGPSDPLPGWLGAFGVNVFFAISGYLVVKSWTDRRDALAFVEARALRIFPALVASVLLCAFIVGPALSTYPLASYAADWRLRWFVVGNISMLLQVEELPGLFMSNPHPGVVNGSLWTLPREVSMYLAVLGIGLLALRKRPFVPLLVGFVVILALASWKFHAQDQVETSLTLTRVSRYFAAGAIMFLTEQLWGRGTWLVAALAGGIAMLVVGGTLKLVFLPWIVVAGMLGIAMALRLPLVGGRWHHDLSYGLYVYAYPTQQVLMAFLPDLGGYLTFVTSLVLTAGVAWMSWRFVERPALALKGRLPRPFGKLRRVSE